MKLEEIRIELRPRRAWEAMDLGLAMVRTWWQPAYGAWVALSLPLFLAVNLLTGASPWSILVMWWLKPVLERPLLHVYSRAAFGSTPTLRDTLRAFPGLLIGTGLLWHLTIGRLLDFSRSYRLPVMQLEGLKGRARRDRLRIITARDGGHATAMAFVYLCLWLIIALGILWLGYLLVPLELQVDPFDWMATQSVTGQFIVNTIAWTAMAFVEPAHVASGFALYLNRRTVLEAWDIELNLRRMASRLAGVTAALTGAVALALMLTVAATDEAMAAKTRERAGVGADPQIVIEEILADPVFGEEQTVSRWRLRKAEEEREEPDLPSLDGLGAALSAIFRFVAWAAAAAVVIALLVTAWRHREALLGWIGRRKPQTSALVVPHSIGALQLSPETLPDDIAAAAEAAWRDGAARDALALLYRGTIVRLVAGGVRLRAADTEADVLRRSESLLPDDPMAALRDLVAAWQQLAYAHRAPAEERFAALLNGFRDHFTMQPG